MATPATRQPLLNTPKNTTLSCKILCTAATLFAVLFSVAFLLPHLNKTSQYDVSVSSHLCNRAYDPEECSRFVSDGVKQNDGKVLLQKLLLKYADQMKNGFVEAKNVKNQINGRYEQGALEDCTELLDLSIDLVTDSAMALADSSSMSRANAQAWLSGVLTNHVTCFDELTVSRRTSLGKIMEEFMSKARAFLAMLAELTAPEEEMLKPMKGKVPSWLTLRDRKLLESSAEDIKADLVVAQDGTGDYLTLSEAVAAAPNKSETRFVIYVKNGTYEDHVEVPKKKKNLMIVGDGMNSTIITGSLNFVDGTTTFRSATLAAVGPGFILQDICIQNTAGPEKHQAVALRVGADQSVINRCRIDAYQDTLYTHSQRQFYRDCTVSGTIDYIFGNSAAVLQNCTLIARKPMANQQNMVTAQSRTDPNQNTGISIQNCYIIASDDLEPVKSSFPTYLGRPWKEYARVMVMQSYIGDHIDPAGWSKWSGDFALETLYFAEYMNEGPGAGTSKRVNWTGYHIVTDPAEAMNFTVLEFIQGNEWLASTGVAYTEGLAD